MRKVIKRNQRDKLRWAWGADRASMFAVEYGFDGQDVEIAQARGDHERFPFSKLYQVGVKELELYVHSNRWYRWEVDSEWRE